jgi:enoyl-CoA hydratase/carnithine racemase
MSQERLSVEVRGHVLCMGLNRPDKYNAMDLDMYRQLAAAYGRLHSDDNLRCGLLFAHGKHFTAGLELDQWQGDFGAGHFPELPDGAINPFGIDPDRRVGKPVVSAVQGICFTAGLELMLATDVRVAASDTRFGQIEVKRGIYPVGGGTVRWVQSIGWGNAMRYLLTGDEMPAAEAHRTGLVQELVEPGEQFERGLDIADRIARQAPLAVRATLNSSRLSLDAGERKAYERLLPDLAPIMESDDAQEGVQSFLERREARFTGQ